jgi:ubiquinone/menaquinone biosynthesis C-methylase UbiE
LILLLDVHKLQESSGHRHPHDPIFMSLKFHDHFSTVAGRYADFRPHYPAALFDYLSTLAPRSSLVWDCAAGNGQATVDLAGRFDRVVATDASREQIASAQPHPKAEYRVAPAEQSELPDHSVDLITVAQALHWFDFDRFYHECRRVLKPDGVLATWAYGVTEVEGEEPNRINHDFYANTVGPYWPPERKWVEEGYRTIPFPFKAMTPPPPAFRMETHWTLDQLVGYFSTWSATSRYTKANGSSPIPELAERLGRAWGDAKATRRIVWPLSLRVGTNSE